MNSTDQLPPCCEESEWRLVACALEKPSILPDLDSLTFYCEGPRQVLELCQRKHRAGETDPQISVLMELSRTNSELFHKAQVCMMELSSPEHWTMFQEDLESLALQRETIRLSAEFEQQARDGTFDSGNAAERIKKLRKRADDGRTLDAKKCAEKLIDDLERRCNLNGQRSGLSTGLHYFDELTDGLQFGEQTIIAARPSIGKTALACNFIERICVIDGHRSALVTLEMSAAAIGRRILSSFARIKMGRLRTGQFTAEDFKAFASFQEHYKKSPLQIIDGVSGMDIFQVTSAIRKLHRQEPLKLVVIDYLQKIRPATKHEKRTYEVAEVSGLLRSLAVETGAAFVTLAQLNRESEKDKGRMPRLADLADSGQIERDADCVGLLHRKDADAKLIVAKQRDGETGLVPLIFNGQFCRFENPI